MSIVKIFNINPLDSNFLVTRSLKKKENKFNNKQYKTIPNSYKDFNINFKGRTPENFYIQDYNQNSMPSEMKKYLDADFEARKHIPPEQVMREVFKYLDIASNVEEAKELYSDEKLFQNLHEANIKGRSGILSDIKLAQEIEKAPLFKNSNDNFGIYLLRKIYIEGKTIREINKDFFDKDLNDTYKGIITQPITYGTTSAYGIRYPKNDFWHSFIATRDEYKKFFIENLPKAETPKIISGNEHRKAFINKNKTNNNNSATQKKPQKKKYIIKDYQKKALNNDIKSTNADKNAIEKVIRKRFSQNNPEASFFIKYLSPIMTIAADRIHLSEEIKYFAESEKDTKPADNMMFKRFWKANPNLLEQYSTAITDTMDLFTDVYAAGGNIHINNLFEEINDNTENKKIIDSISPEFKELLDYVQTIVPNRNKKYEEHNKLQAEWEEYFNNKYGTLEATVGKNVQSQIQKQTSHNAGEKILILKDINDKPIEIKVDVEKAFKDYIINQGFKNHPIQYANFYYKEILKSPQVNDLVKLTIALEPYREKLQDGQIMPISEALNILNKAFDKNAFNNQKITKVSNCAQAEFFAHKTENPEQIYRFLLGDFSDLDKECFSIVTSGFNNTDKDYLNKMYDKFFKPTNITEAQKIALKITQFISNYNKDTVQSTKSVLYDQKLISDYLSVIKTAMNNDDRLKRNIKNIFVKLSNTYSALKMILEENKNDSSNLKHCRIEATVMTAIKVLLENNEKFLQSLNNDETATLLILLENLKQKRALKKF